MHPPTPPHPTHTCIAIMRHFRDRSAPSCERLTHLHTSDSLQKTAECVILKFLAMGKKMVKFPAMSRYLFVIKPEML